jgi:uncharacterized membrane protein YcaP (DUF421 family)
MADYIYSGIDWEALFVPDTPLLETFIRGTAVYLSIFLLLRFILMRDPSGVSITDVLVIVLIADAAQNAMAGEYRGVTDGILLVSVIIFWSFALERAAFRWPVFERLLHPPPLELIREGEIRYENLRKQAISEEELFSTLREQGVDDVSKVERAYLEGDGQISVLAGGAPRRNRPRRRTFL